MAQCGVCGGTTMEVRCADCIKHLEDENARLIQQDDQVQTFLRETIPCIEDREKIKEAIAKLPQWHKLEAERDELKEAQYVPGQWACAACDFHGSFNVISGGNVGADTDPLARVCPNGCGMMDRVTWKKWTKDLEKYSDSVVDERNKLREALESAEHLCQCMNDTHHRLPIDYRLRAIKALLKISDALGKEPEINLEYAKNEQQENKKPKDWLVQAVRDALTICDMYPGGEEFTKGEIAFVEAIVAFEEKYRDLAGIPKKE